MKNFKILTAVLVLFAAFNMISCGDTEPVDESIIIPIPTNPGGNTTGDCAEPAGFQASGFIDGTNINLSWISTGEETEWEVAYGASGMAPGNGTTIVTENTNVTITGLNPENGYHFYVRAVCPDGGFSSWVGPVSAGTGTSGCSVPTGITATRTEGNLTEVVVSWTAAGSASQWEIEYGFAGHTPGTGTSVISTVPTKTLSNLSQNQDFHIYVRSICGPDETSYWAGPITVEAINALSANIDGVSFVPTDVTAGTTTVEDVDYIEVSGANEDGNIVSVFVKKNLGVGTYHDAPDALFSYTLDGDEFTADPETPPTVTVTEKTAHSMVGTFSFTVVNETDTDTTVYEITNGSFAVTF